MTDAVTIIDADALLEAGHVPVGPVFEAAHALSPGEQLHVLVSFPPVPLIERLEGEGFRCVLGANESRFVLSVEREAPEP